MHYSEILPEVVFIDAQVILDKITELVEYSLRLRANQPTKFQVIRAVRGCDEFKLCGIITQDINFYHSLNLATSQSFLKTT